MDKFSERLVALRKEKDLTQAEFARLCGKQRTTVSGYETEGKEPDFALLCQMADYFGVTTDYLLGREDERAHGNEAFRQDNVNFKRDMTPSRKSSASSPDVDWSMCCSPGV
ncbi:MAG: helix-turn-helix domain-containing protein [Oscillospiraceae bacterium]